MLHWSETWPVRKENEVALQKAEMRMVRWMCGVKLQDGVPSKELRRRLGLDDIISVLQQNRLQWYGHVLWKEDNDWVKKCMEYEVEGTRPRGRPKKTWTEIVKKDCRARGLNREDAMDRSRWRKQIGMIDDHDECEWVTTVGECFFWYRLTRVVPDKFDRAVERLCVCGFIFFRKTCFNIFKFSVQTLGTTRLWFFQLELFLNHSGFAWCVVDDPEGVVWRERASRIYRLISYYLAVVCSEFPAQLLIASIFFTIAYWMTNLMPTAWHFFGTWLILILLMFPSQVFVF